MTKTRNWQLIYRTHKLEIDKSFTKLRRNGFDISLQACKLPIHVKNLVFDGEKFFECFFLNFCFCRWKKLAPEMLHLPAVQHLPCQPKILWKGFLCWNIMKRFSLSTKNITKRFSLLTATTNTIYWQIQFITDNKYKLLTKMNIISYTTHLQIHFVGRAAKELFVRTAS